MEKVRSQKHVTYFKPLDGWIGRCMDGEASEGGKTDVGTGGGNVLTGPGILSL